LFLSVLDYLSSTFTVINELIELTNIDKQLYLIIFKVTAIGYLVEFASDTVNDFGLKSLADKLTFAGKIIIFTISIPIIYSIINLLVGLLQ
jgi:stage III sporulation protein AD